MGFFVAGDFTGCMFCGVELDSDGNHKTTGNPGCVSPSNPERETVSVIKRHTIHHTTKHFIPAAKR